ncbi:hypothetical protein [Bacillus suaedaesalsae]|uniref:Lipoprotein n=1 Tax=Bacillus suaedaesalsae TaxID=2810349 RepID=A0ABS2DNC5_9BACI|nr:hypothetical protein [Bacillus suaedaesalsae]MBM6619545.1 hypothetical protein [Bacillus suaedaesalsae]
MKGFVRILVVAISLTACFGFKCEAKTFYTPPVKSIEELYQDIFVSLLGVEIDKAVDSYYKDVLNEPPTVYPY